MTFVDRFTADDDTDLHGRTPTGAGASYNVTAGSFSIQGGEAQSGAADSVVYIDTGETNLLFSLLVRTGDGSNVNTIRFRWDQVSGTGWYLNTSDGAVYYYNGSSSTLHNSFSYNFHGNGNRWYYDFDLTDPEKITINVYNLQFISGWLTSPLVISSTLNNDKTSVGFTGNKSGVTFDCLRCQSGSYDYPYQGLMEARIQRHILEDHVPNIIALYASDNMTWREAVWAENGDYSPYYDGWYCLLTLADMWGVIDGALFLEAAWKQFQVTHDDYYTAEWIGTPYAVQGWRPYSEGAYELWTRLAIQDAYDTVRYFPSNAIYNGSGDLSIEAVDTPNVGRHRECALALSTHVFAHKIGGIAASELNESRWDELREWNYEWVDYWCDETTPGEYAWTGSERQVAGFMLGITGNALWDDYTVSSDSRFPATLLKLCNFVWDNFWKPENSPYPGLFYDLNPDSPSYGSVDVNNDLNGLLIALFAKCAQLTGNSIHMDRADTLNSHSALYGSFYRGKQRNQAIKGFKKYVDLRAEFYAPPQVRRSGHLFRRSA